MKICKEPLQTILHPVQIQIMAKPGLGIDARNARLSWVNLPGMKVENGRLTILPIDVLQQPALHNIGHQTEVATTTGRPVAIEETRRRHRYFE